MKIAIIGGTGLTDMPGIEWQSLSAKPTAFGHSSAIPRLGRWQNTEFLFLPRHGKHHSIAPHRINYLANIATLKNLGVTHILAVNAVGGLADHLGPGTLAVPDQIIDYSWGRESSFCDGVHGPLDHIDFTQPYASSLRQSILQSADIEGIAVVDGGVYACTQGPRLETAAEIQRLRNDGCHLVGMTGMPEAVLAREAGMDYASLCLVVNWGAGMTDEAITLAQIHEVLRSGVEDIMSILLRALTLIAK